MEPLLDSGKSEGGSVPPWVYGAASAGIAGISIVGVTIYHYVSRKKRYEQARVQAAKIMADQAQQITPREAISDRPNPPCDQDVKL
jgi:hypothetical protein